MQAIWGFGNIAGDSRNLRDKVIQTGFINDLVTNSEHLPMDIQINAVWMLSNIFRYKDHLKVEDIDDNIQILGKFLRESKNNKIIRDCTWSFNCLNTNQSIISYLVHQME